MVITKPRFTAIIGNARVIETTAYGELLARLKLTKWLSKIGYQPLFKMAIQVPVQPLFKHASKPVQLQLFKHPRLPRPPLFWRLVSDYR